MKRALWVGLVLMTLGCSRVVLEPARYACTLGGPAGQCPGDWRCLPEGFCVDPTKGGAWACRLSSDCTGGWHCGVEGLCYELATATNVVCRLEGNDCAPSWACGLDLRCLDTSKPDNNNRCDRDEDCFGGQRCASTRCIDVQADALRPSTTVPTLVRGDSPFLGARPVTAYESTKSRRWVFGVVGNELRWLDLEATQTFDGGSLHRLAQSGPPPLELAVVENPADVFELVKLHGDGGLTVFSPTSLAERPLPLPFAATGLRLTGDPLLPLAVLGNAGLALGTTQQLQVELGLDAGVVRDLLFLTGDALVLSTSTGGWSRPYDKSGFSDGGWEPAFCDESGAMTQLQLVRPGTDPSRPEYLAFTSDGGTTTFRRFAEGTGTAGACPTTVGTRTFQLEQRPEPSFALSQPRAALIRSNDVGVAGLSDRGVPTVVWADGGANFEALSVVDERLVVSDDLGRVLLQERFGPMGLEPLMPASAPLRTLGREATVTLTLFDKDREAINPLATARACFSRREGSWCQAGRPSTFQRSVRGAAEWVVTSTDPLSPPPYSGVVFEPGGGQVAFQEFDSAPRVFVAAAQARIGSTLIVTGGLDYLSFGDFFPSGTANSTRLAVSPLPRGEITDVVLTNRPPATDATYAEGWVVASGRVFRFYASSRALWRSEEVVLDTDAEALRVWLDGSRPRAGDIYGQVFALDSVVKLSRPIEDAFVRDYASFCNHDFAVTDTHELFRLTASTDGGTLAEWEKIPTPAPMERVTDDGDELRAFDTEGRAYWFEGLPCEP